MTPTEWIAAATWTQAVATLVLVAITGWYAFKIREQAEAAAESAEATRRSAQATEDLVELSAPGVRERRTHALVRLQEIAEALDKDADTLQRYRNHDKLRDLFSRWDLKFAELSMEQELSRLSARVGGEIDAKAWSVREAIVELEEKAREISVRMRSGEELRDLDPIAFADRAEKIRSTIARLEHAIDRELGPREDE